MLSFLKQVGKGIIDLLYPPLCLHCRDILDPSSPVFCKECLQLLELIDPRERCPYCFSADFHPNSEYCCSRCKESPPLLTRMAAAFDYEGPATTLVTHLKYGGQIGLAKGMGAYLVAQFICLGWPIPDVIIPMPMAPLRRMERGYNQSMLLAQEMATAFSVPVRDIIRRQSGEFSQAGLNYQQRLKLRGEGFIVKNGKKLHDQVVLLIDDVMTTGSSLHCCAEALLGVFPKEVYSLTFARAL